MRATMVRGLTGCTLVVASLLAAPAPAQARVHADARGVAAATHPSRGVPSLLWATDAAVAPAGLSAEQAARHHLERLSPTYRVPRNALAAARLLFVHDTGRGGIIVALRQTVAGVDVFHGDIKVLLERGSHRLIAVAGTPHPANRPRAAFTGDARISAVAVALKAVWGVDLAGHITASREAARAGFTYLDVAVPAPVDLILRRPARIKPIYFPQGDSLRPAHYVELQGRLHRGRDNDAHAVIVGDDGRVLHRQSLTANEAYNYRVYADPDGRPLESPLEDYIPHPKGEPVDGPTKPIFPSLVSMEGFNHNPDGEPDPWLPPGAKETLGNNVDAFADWTDPDGLSGDEHRAKINSFNTFDYVYDISVEPLGDQTQSMAVITSLFYVTNWNHDWWYDSGFNEAAGNAQASNFGRGGVEHDVMLAEAQDAAIEGARNNANMSTPQDGESPVMQMYLWTPLHEDASVHTEPQGADITAGQARFGPRKYDFTAPLVLVDDGSDKPTEGCNAPVNDVAGKIVLVDRGSCEFEVKAQNVEAAGALGVVFPDSLPNMDAYPPGPDPNTLDPTIPAQGISKADGDALKAALGDGPVTATMHGDTSAERDGTIDNMIVAHEWGHYLHFRLSTCGSAQCGAHSEGWGDFNALMHALREGDPLDGTYGAAIYGTFDPTGYFGLRRAAYTVDMAKNATTFKHISDGAPLPPPPYFQDNFINNAESHNAGEIWATMMWEAYIGLHMAHQDDLEFEAIRRRMGDYVVGGLMMAPPDPSYTEMRDAILAAAYAADKDDFVTIAEAFARRGVGTCARSPDKLDNTFSGVVEDFEIRPNGVILGASLDDSVESCDQDGVLDAAETGRVKFKVRNAGIVPMSGATLALSSTSDTVQFVGGDVVDVPDLDPQSEADLEFDLTLVDSPPDLEDITVTLTLTTPDGCEKDFKLNVPTRLNGDIAEGASATDDVDAPITPWVISGATDGIWTRDPNGTGGYLWHGIDFGSVSDTALESPTLEVSDSDPLVITFLHAYDFEFTDGTYWDGGLLELSTDGGQNWQDLSTWLDPGYDGAINNEVNPIHMRPVFGGQSPDFPAPHKVTLDLGSTFAGQDIKFRFRIGTDGFVGATGWYIDDIGFAGIDNTPFSKWIPDACGPGNPTTSESEGDSDHSSDSDGPPTTPTEGSEGSDGSSDGPPLDDETAPCGCAATPSSGLFSLFGLLLLPRRRRRSA